MSRDDWGTFNWVAGGLFACLLTAMGFSLWVVATGILVGGAARYVFSKWVPARGT